MSMLKQAEQYRRPKVLGRWLTPDEIKKRVQASVSKQKKSPKTKA